MQMVGDLLVMGAKPPMGSVWSVGVCERSEQGRCPQVYYNI